MRHAAPPPLRRISAGVVWPVIDPPIRNGALLIARNGRIAAIGPDDRVPRPPPSEVETVTYPSNAAILPGLVNVHTHLELTALGGRVPEANFFEWIQHVRRFKQSAAEDELLEGAKAGVYEAWRHGITTVADTGTTKVTVRALNELGGRGIYYHEVIAPEPTECEAAFDHFVRELEAVGQDLPTSVRLGVSPHAPYTVSPELFRLAAAYARAEGLPLASHVAESKAEVELVTVGGGPFATNWRSRGIPLPPAAPSALHYVERLGLLGPDLLVIHAVQTNPADIELLRESDTAVGVCLRSNRRHGHGEPPLGALLAAGVRLALGTDSLASVEALDLFEEARAAQALANLSAEKVLRLITHDAACAIGMDQEIGSLGVDKWADLCVMRTNPSPGGRSPSVAEAVLSVGAAGVVATYVAGRRVYNAADASPVEI